MTLLNSILQVYLVNAVVEEQYYGSWWVRKYANGYAECFVRQNVGSVTLSTPLGTDIVSGPIRIYFPFAFKEKPLFCSVTYEHNSTGYAVLQHYNGAEVTTEQTYPVRLARIGNASVTLANNIFNVHVLGKYK